MLIVDRRRDHDDPACAPRRQRKTQRRRAYVGESSQLEAKPPDFDAQSRAMRFIGVLRLECASKQRASRNVCRPRLTQRAYKREQDRARCERDHGLCIAHHVAAGVDDERPRSQQRFNLLKQEKPLLARSNQTRGGRVQDEGSALDLRHQRRNARTACGALCLGERRARRLDPQAPHRDTRDHQFVGGPQCRRQGCGIELRQRAFGLVEAPDQQKTADLEMPRVRRVRPVAVPLERRPCRIERLRGPAQVARHECNLGLGNDAPRPGHRFFRAEAPRRSPQQGLRPNEIAELSHRDAAQRQSRRVVAQRDPLQCAEGVARCEGLRCGSDQRVHRNPAKLVTPIVSPSGVRSVS